MSEKESGISAETQAEITAEPQTAAPASEAAAQAENRARARRRKKSLMLLAGCVVLVGLAGVYMGLQRHNAKQQSQTEATPSVAVATLPASGSVDRLTFQSTDGLVTFTQAQDGSWSYDADSEFTVDASSLDALLNSVANLNATGQFTPEQAAETYGLDQPSQVVVLTDTATGQFTTLTFGDTNPVTQEVYLQVNEDSSTLYTVASTLPGAFSVSLESLRQAEEKTTEESSSPVLANSETEESASTGEPTDSEAVEGAEEGASAVESSAVTDESAQNSESSTPAD